MDPMKSIDTFLISSTPFILHHPNTKYGRKTEKKNGVKNAEKHASPTPLCVELVANPSRGFVQTAIK